MSESISRPVILLPFGLPSLAGNYFDRADLENIFPEYQQRVLDGNALVELGKPAQLRTQEDVKKFHTIDLNNVCAKIDSVEITDDGIIGTFVLAGPMAELLEQLLHPDPNVLPMFSMRSVVLQRNMKAVPQRIIGFDATEGMYSYDTSGPRSYGVHSATGLAPGLYARTESENNGTEESTPETSAAAAE